uniref:ATP synthase complex subunit 8 n=1 Tax=Melophagus ovinus TaxID=452749 RepID=A0A343WAT4_9MUSC|nr:ATPase subunit 8 [Melophagus ovinus]ART65745.1 ATPase subunit 8 [Melophagus ovinus]AWB97138.1 ATP synthase F0 subunit 8 [Melophagus ovinus]
MPQMAPINWLSLFFMFNFIFIILCMLNYFNYNLMITKSKNKMNNFSMIWKW